MKTCKVEGCNGKHIAKGYCDKHYRQYKRYGKISERTRFDPNKIIEYDDYAEIVLYNKHCEEVARALIDLEDVDKVKGYKWHLRKDGYVSTHITKGETTLLHRLIMDCPDDKLVDHINHNKLDNRETNLRICTKSQNAMNQNIKSNNTSGIVGVSWDKKNEKWIANIGLSGKYINLGYFDNIEEAAKKRKQAEIDLFGDYRNKDEDVI